MLRHSLSFTALLSLACLPQAGAQTDYSWNLPSGNGTWSTSGNWTPSGPPTAIDNMITPTGTGDLRINVTDAEVVDWTFNDSTQPGGDWDVLSSTAGATLTSTGTFLKQGSDAIRIRSSSLGDLTVNYNIIDHQDGILDFGDRNSTSSDLFGFSANTVTVSGDSLFRFNMDEAGTGAAISGSLTLEDTAEVYIRQFSSGSTTLSVGSLNSTDTTTAVFGNDFTTSTATATLELNNSSGTATYAGSLEDNSTDSVGNTTTLSVVKNGAGTQEFSGTDNDYTGTTTVNGGTLLISGQHSQSTQFAQGGDYTVNSGGTLAGTNGEIQTTIITNNDAGINILSGGMLAIGPNPGETGIFSADLGAGVMDITGAVGGANTGALVFDLAAIGASDQFRLVGGTLAIGTGELEFFDFDFTALAGIQEGDYVLFETADGITGTLGAGLTGTFDTYEGTLAISGNDLILSVTMLPIPEPSSLAAFLLGGALLAFRRRR